MIDDLDVVLPRIRTPQRISVEVDGAITQVISPFPSPRDWRDVWLYSLLIDRFNNPARPPRLAPWDAQWAQFQGGTIDGIRARLDYLAGLGVGAILLSPVLKNCQHDPTAYHGYGPQDFLCIEPRFACDPSAAQADPGLAERELTRLVLEAHARGIYVLLDVVLHHVGDVFVYPGYGGTAPWSDQPRPILWRDENGVPRPDWSKPPVDAPRDAIVWPKKLRRNEFYTRHGNAFTGLPGRARLAGDFVQQKELATEFREGGTYPVRDFLVTVYRYMLAKYDFDGYRIDSLKSLDRQFAVEFSREIREFALSIGKHNFLLVGEMLDGDETIASVLGYGRRADDEIEEAMAVPDLDSAFDFPAFFILTGVAKGMRPPLDLARLWEKRHRLYARDRARKGDPSRFFVTFLDNHDQTERFRHCPPDNPSRFDDQVTLALACLFTLEGIPCLYYGTEQGLHAAGDKDDAVREALWGKPGTFDLDHNFSRTCRTLGELRARLSALRYGRQTFRPVSSVPGQFAIADYPGGVLAFSRHLSEDEVLVVANCSTTAPWRGGGPSRTPIESPARPLCPCFQQHRSERGPSPNDRAHRPHDSVASAADGSLHLRPALRVASSHPEAALPAPNRY